MPVKTDYYSRGKSYSCGRAAHPPKSFLKAPDFLVLTSYLGHISTFFFLCEVIYNSCLDPTRTKSRARHLGRIQPHRRVPSVRVASVLVTELERRAALRERERGLAVNVNVLWRSSKCCY